MQTQLPILLLNFITPFVMIFVGAGLKKHPVSDMRTQNGYNTPTSRKSQAHWDYAQKIAPDIYISFGKWLSLGEMVIIGIGLTLHASVGGMLITGFAVGMCGLIYSFIYTDGQIRKVMG